MDLTAARDAAQAQDFPKATLYVVAGPIGNLADLTVRGAVTLARVERVFAEDTRIAAQLLRHYGIHVELVAAHRHNERGAAQSMLAALAEGERVAYLSDAGTPAISDPGALLVAAVRAAGFRVIPIPGSAAVTTALSVAGLDDGPFYFGGFLPQRQRQVEEALQKVADLGAHLVFYEAPHRLRASLAVFLKVFGPTRRIVVARELTKVFESIEIMPLGDVAAWLAGNPHHERGEFVLIVEAGAAANRQAQDGDAVLRRLLPSVPLSTATALAAELTGLPRKVLYARALELKRTLAAAPASADGASED